jgi:adenylylsulfate kinase-like enzyme
MLLRIQGILMSLAGHTTGEIADQLKAHRSTARLGYRSGRRSGLSGGDRDRVCDIFRASKNAPLLKRNGRVVVLAYLSRIKSSSSNSRNSFRRRDTTGPLRHAIHTRS